MVKIIKQGVIPEQVTKEISCRNCNSVLEYKMSDIQYSIDPRERWPHINCPVCKTDVTVPSWST